LGTPLPRNSVSAPAERGTLFGGCGETGVSRKGVPKQEFGNEAKQEFGNEANEVKGVPKQEFGNEVNEVNLL
jgi:hypothetical protein